MELATTIFNDITRNPKVQDFVLPLCAKIDEILLNQTYYSHHFYFKTQHSLEDRGLIYANLIKKFPAKIPIVVEFASDNTKESRKMLLDHDEYVVRLIATIKREWSQSIYILTDTNKCLMSSETVGELYKQYLCEKKHDGKDKIMYLVVYCENTFG
jgi:hypothetical protein